MIAREHRVGFVTPPGDAASLARVIERAITIPDELRAMGMRARKLAEEKFDRGHAVRQFAQLIDDVESSTRGCETAGQQNSMSA